MSDTSSSDTEREKVPGETGYFAAPTSNNPEREAGWRWFPEEPNRSVDTDTEQ